MVQPTNNLNGIVCAYWDHQSQDQQTNWPPSTAQQWKELYGVKILSPKGHAQCFRWTCPQQFRQYAYSLNTITTDATKSFQKQTLYQYAGNQLFVPDIKRPRAFWMNWLDRRLNDATDKYTNASYLNYTVICKAKVILTGSNSWNQTNTNSLEIMTSDDLYEMPEYEFVKATEKLNLQKVSSSICSKQMVEWGDPPQTPPNGGCAPIPPNRFSANPTKNKA